MSLITCVDDLRRLHKRRVPKMFYDYSESGSWTESTFVRNESVFNEILLRQRVAVDLTNRSQSKEILGERGAMPVALAPTGMAGMQCSDGEIKAAQAAEEFGVPFTLSTMSICSIEDVAENTSKPFWFQLYVMKDRRFVESLIDRAKKANCSALVETLDLQILGQRHKDIKNQLSAPPRLTIKNVVNMMTKPRWCMGMLTTRRHQFGNIVGHADGVDDLSSLSSWSAEQLDPSLNWDDIEWIKERWGGPLILKGIMDPLDARHALDSGADALIVSNHGGRQLDGAPATLEVLPTIVAEVGDRISVFMDGGIRSGQDVYKAVALGAEACFIGKAFLNGLGAMGKAGVTRCLELILIELDLTMAFCGYRDINDVDGRTLWQNVEKGSKS